MLTVDGTHVPNPDHMVAEQPENYRHLINHQVVIDADTRLVVAVGRPVPGNRNDCKAWEMSGTRDAVGRTTVIADGGYRAVRSPSLGPGAIHRCWNSMSTSVRGITLYCAAPSIRGSQVYDGHPQVHVGEHQPARPLCGSVRDDRPYQGLVALLDGHLRAVELW